MATRLYMPAVVGAPAAPIAPAVDTAWERSSSTFYRAKTATTKSNTSLADASAQFASTATSQTCWAQFVSEALDVDQTITGTMSMVIRGSEASLAEDLHLAFSLRVITPALGVRGQLLLFHATSTEFGTIPQTRIHSARALTSVAALAGDYIVMEVGFHGVTPANANPSGVLRFGDPTAGADFALTSGLTTDDVPWFELSQNITFGAPPPATRPVDARRYGQAVKRASFYAPDAKWERTASGRLWQVAA